MADSQFFTGDEATLYLDGGETCGISGWELTLKGNLKKKGTNCSRYPYRIAGRPDVEGNFTLNLKKGETIPVQHGARYRAQFHLDDTGGNYFECYIAIDEIPIPAEIDEGGEFECQVTWGIDGGELERIGLTAGSSSA